MFSWSFSKPAEAMFSRWAIKRVCKFLLKKKLGKFILGDIDLNQLDVQLGDGTIKLSDLAVNVDYINEKFGTAPILVKEGSVGLLTVTMPWKDGGCQIEVDELEIVLAPRRVKLYGDEVGSFSPSKNEKGDERFGSRKMDSEAPYSGGAGFAGVHDGVKTIANWVKWLLTSFHVKIKKLIVAFDPLLDEEDRIFDRILVLHLSEIECGTHLSEDNSASSDYGAPSILGSSRLTSFLRFHGARLELLHGDDRHSHPTTESDLCDSFTECRYSYENITTVISGEKGGFSGSLKLSLPWKNGSLDIHKVDADLEIEPFEVKLQPSTIRCFIFMWGLFEGACERAEESGHPEPLENLPPTDSLDKGFLCKEGSVDKNCLNDKKPATFLLSESQLISDWVTRSHGVGGEEEPDFEASVEQFFECFDELRSSQSALGNSGMWTWTCSVFSAITAASNLASGSLRVPAEQLHVETKFNATIAKVCVRLSFIDEDQKQYEVKDNKAYTGLHNHVVCAELVGLGFVLQVLPQETNFDVTVQHIQLVDHLCCNNILSCSMHGNCENEIAVIHKIQHDVQDALLTFGETNNGPSIDQKVDISLDLQNAEKCFHMANGKNIGGTVILLKTSGVTRCQVRMKSISSGSSSVGPLSFSLELAPFVCWLDFDLITTTLKFLIQTANCFEGTRAGNGLGLKSESTSTNNSFKGNIVLPNARMLLCFPLKEHGDCSVYSSCHQVFALDIISPTIGVEKALSSKPLPVASFGNKDPVANSSSLSVHIGNFHIFSVSSVFNEEIARIEAHSGEEANYTVEKILSAVDKSGYLSLFSVHWRAGSKTGPWITQKAKHLASSENGRREGTRVAKNSEFASVTTAKDVASYDTHSRQEIFSSSALFLHAKVPPVAISLGKSQYENINDLLHMFDQISSVFPDSGNTNENPYAAQTSVFLECESVNVAIAVELLADVKSSTLSELSGSWLSLTLQVDKFELISTSNIGGVKKASFLWVSHHQGSLWGSVTECMNEKLLLISCSNSALGRGDGVGSNVLCSGYAGTDFIHFWDRNTDHNLISITVRGATVIANGGRLDWFSSLSSFFAPPSDEFDQVSSNRKEQSSESSFVLNLVDAGLSYEPYLKKLEDSQDTDFTILNSNSTKSENKYTVACLLAASNLKLSNTCVDCPTGEYKIRLQDLGLLLCPVYQEKSIGGTYSAQRLGMTGYVKVAQEAHLEVILRTNCENGHLWELECVESHIMLSTCHDTTLGLTTLAGQLQKLFAPDMQDYAVHLENRWNNIQKVRGRSDEETSDCESPSVSLTEASSVDKRSKIGSLMDEVLDDIFQLDGNCNSEDKLFGSRRHTLENDSHVVCKASSSEDKISDIIDEYFLSDLHPTAKSLSSDVIYHKTFAVKEVQIRNDGWYMNSPLRILDNHLSEVEWIGEQKPINVEASSCDSENSNAGKVEGNVHLKNMNLTWRMYDGSDWCRVQSTYQTSTIGRDSKTCMELSLSGIDFNCDVYPD